MRGWLLTMGAALALGGCQSAEERRAAETGEINVTNASSEEVTRLLDAAAPKTAVQPGMWRARLRVEDLDIAGLPADQRQTYTNAMKRMERDVTSCRKADDLKPLDLEALERVAGECTFVRYSSQGGKVDAELSCTREGAAPTRVTITGRTSKTAFEVTTTQSSGKPGEAGYVSARLRANGSRIGDCPGA